MKKIMSELELYHPMRLWLKEYLEYKYKDYKIFVYDTHSERLDKFLSKIDIRVDAAVGIDIQIDVLGVAVHNKTKLPKLFFIEAKKTRLTLRDLGQLWSYCKL